MLRFAVSRSCLVAPWYAPSYSILFSACWAWESPYQETIKRYMPFQARMPRRTHEWTHRSLKSFLCLSHGTDLHEPWQCKYWTIHRRRKCTCIIKCATFTSSFYFWTPWDALGGNRHTPMLRRTRSDGSCGMVQSGLRPSRWALSGSQLIPQLWQRRRGECSEPGAWRANTTVLQLVTQTLPVTKSLSPGNQTVHTHAGFSGY